MHTNRRSAHGCGVPLFRRAILILAMPALLLILTGCGEPEIESRWRDREIVVDGDHSEWEGAVTYVEEADAVIGLLNDETHLYLCLASTSPNTTTQVLAHGLTLWFDPDGRKQRTRGIHFPLGARETGFPMGSPGERPDPDAMLARLNESEPELELIPGDGLPTRMFLAQAAGIDLDIGMTKGALVYEARIPLLQDGGSFAIGAGAGSEIGIGLTTPKIDMERMLERMDGQGPPGGRGGGMRGRGPRGMPGMPKPLDIWAKVKIASGAEAKKGI